MKSENAKNNVLLFRRQGQTQAKQKEAARQIVLTRHFVDGRKLNFLEVPNNLLN
jgi:hypothetical protein